MKNIYYILILFLGLSFIGCEPMEDIHDDINDEIDGSGALADKSYTLTEDDYESLGSSFPNFNSEEDARTLIPDFLDAQYPFYGEGSSINVTFDIYDPIRVEDYEVTSDDYNEAGLDVDYFTGTSQIYDVLETVFPQADNGDYINLMYETVAEEIPYAITAEDFDLIGDNLGETYPDEASSAAQYSNFDRREDRDAYWSNDMILEAINVVLDDNFDDVTNQIYNVSYAVYDGSAGTESMTVQFNGNAYVAFGGTSYEVSAADFDEIGNEFAEEFPQPASSAAQYSNFERRDGNASAWTEAMILEAINFLLDSKFPDASEGTQFAVTYAVYTGAAGSEVINVVKVDGDYELDLNASVSTITTTEVFAFTNGSWGMPFTLAMEDYEALGQSYPNFSNEDQALYRIGIYLGMQFPYAEEGDITAVAYDLYSSGETSTEYVNYIFEDGEFSLIPSTRTSSLKFGLNDGLWVPDNTIRYSLTGDDYVTIATALEDTYPTPASSMLRYSNFDTRSDNDNYWSPDMILEAVNILLNDINPSAAVGQKYIVTYAVYNGSNTTNSLSVIKVEDGSWVLNE
ncbi:hypothetical protein [Zunongwangia endophytica]|uniref:DUF5017 domain-containing protein n=1 Tax=Zunongwangia endophytica TaxID=1808945 RepID=A0ABV8H6C9_9FLAO|nr:hypothetical protein [Zunongwangia endophytica]MDN3595764.1 hypothetical protein [Zunongwangia endophytica]